MQCLAKMNGRICKLEDNTNHLQLHYHINRINTTPSYYDVVVEATGVTAVILEIKVMRRYTICSAQSTVHAPVSQR